MREILLKLKVQKNMIKHLINFSFEKIFQNEQQGNCVLNVQVETGVHM